MSAICGMVHRFGGELRPDAVVSMVERMRVYGPDGGGHWQAGAAALGVRQLHVTPESLEERLPLAEDGVVLVSDARLDNRDELLAALGVSAVDAPRTPDSGLLLLAYRRWAEACVTHLVGDFAFALWDRRRRLLFCARDPMGVRPFYYHPGPEVFAFATDERAVLELPEVPWDLDETAVVDRLVLNAGSDPTATHFAAIRRLPPAHTLTLRNGEVRTRRYWAPDLDRDIRYGRREEYVDAYREHLERAVRDRLRSAFPVASHLSGGIDSPTVASLAARELARTGHPRLLTYSNVLAGDEDWPPGDERPLIEAILADGPHMEARFVTTAGKSMVRSVAEGGIEHGMPGWGTQFITEAAADARRRGARVFLGGYGGDQVATTRGELGLSELLSTGRWLTFAGAVRLRAQGSGRSALRVAGGAALRLLPPGAQRLAAALRHPGRAGFGGAGREAPGTFVSPDLAARVGLPERLREQARSGKRVFRRLRDYQWYRLSEREPQRSMELTHPQFARHGLEHALPLLDVRLVEYCLAIPCEQHMDAHTRALVRHATRGILPDVVRLREDKRHAAIPAPPRYVAGDQDELRASLDRMQEVPLVRDFINVARLRACLLEQLPSDIARGRPTSVSLNEIQLAFRTAHLLAWVAERRTA